MPRSPESESAARNRGWCIRNASHIHGILVGDEKWHGIVFLSLCILFHHNQTGCLSECATNLFGGQRSLCLDPDSLAVGT